MAFFTDTHAAAQHPGFFAGFFDRTMALLERVSEAQSRTPQVQALEALTDKELADLGIARQDIVRHVFRDVFYL